MKYLILLQVSEEAQDVLGPFFAVAMIVGLLVVIGSIGNRKD